MTDNDINEAVCRECGKPAKWVLTNVTIHRKPYLCGRHANAVPYSTMNKMGLKLKEAT